MRYHMENAWTKPLIEDQAACSWLLSAFDAIQSVAVNTIPMDEVIQLAELYIKRSNRKCAVKIYFNVLKHAVIGSTDSMRYAKTLLEIVQAIPEVQRDDEDNAAIFRAAFKLFLSHEMGTEMWAVGYDILVKMYKSGISQDNMSMGRVSCFHAMVSVGMTPLNLAPTTDQLQEGYAAMRSSGVFFWRAYHSKMLIGDIANHCTVGLCTSVYGLGFILADIWTEAATDEERLIWSPKVLLQSAEDYDYGKLLVCFTCKSCNKYA
jgi:hypothetical protein